MLTSEKMVCPSASASAEQRRHSLDRFKQDEYFHGSDGDITLRMLRRLARLLGRYSVENEERLAKDIITLIEHEIKEETENHVMRRPYVNKLCSDGKIYRQLYLSTKNIMLEFGKLMSDAADEKRAIAEHRDEDTTRDKRDEAGIVWLLEFELRMIKTVIDSGSYSHMMTEELHDELIRYVSILGQDLEKFKGAHGIAAQNQAMNPDANTTSSE